MKLLELSKLGGSLALRAGLAASLMGMPLVAQAQEAAEDDVASVDEAGNGALLEQVVVGAQGLGQVNTNAAATSSSRLPGSMRDVPQTVNVIPERVLLEQNVNTLEQALSNVPGITAAIGEGRGGMGGDRFRIRGFETLGDTYRDGLRDFGVYVRDSFNMEQVEICKGPNGENFGVGTTGGVIGMTSKRARLGTFGSADASYGTGPLKRTTLDHNWQFDETSAARFNLMGHWQGDIADRDHSISDRWGVAASVGFGLGTNQTLHLDYMFQHNKRTPDYGIPSASLRVGDPTRPVTEFGIRRENYYGKTSDIDDSDVHMLTASYKNDINEWLTIHNDTRYSHYDRFFSSSPANCDAAGCRDALNGIIPDAPYTIGAGGGPAYDQTSWGIQNVTTALAKYELGGLRNEAVFGLDVLYQEDKRQGYRTTNPKIPGTLFKPNNDSSNYSFEPNIGNDQQSDSYNIALFASNRLWFNGQWSVMGGVRWEKQHTSHETGPVAGAGIADLDATWNESWASPKASLIWEPTSNQNYYLSWVRSYNVPSGQNISSEMIFLVQRFGNWKPEKSDLFELGTKLDFLDGNLGLTAALFHVEKDNTYDTNAAGTLTYSGDKRRVQGLELGLTGNITSNWNFYASYTYMQSKILSSNTAANVGRSVEGVPQNAASLWTTYDVAPHLDIGDGKLLIGGGIKYRDAMKINAGGTAVLPHSLSFDGMVSYETEKWNVSLNAYNLTDRINYDTYFGGRSVPSSGRSFVVKVGTKF